MNAIPRRSVPLAFLLVLSATNAACSNRSHSAAPRSAPPVAPADDAISADPGFIRLWAESARFTAGEPSSVTLTPDGASALFLRSGPRTRVRDLYELDLASGRERVLLTADQILQGQEERLTPEELARRERMRMSARGIAGFELSGDGKKILFNLSNRLFVYDRSTGSKTELTAEGGAPIDARFSPDGSMVSCVRQNELHVIELASGRQRRLTEGATPDGRITNGVAEFVAQEEMDRLQGYWWSPDSRLIAYQRNDHTGVESMHILDPSRPENDAQSWFYPRPGKKNVSVRLGVVAAGGGDTRWIDRDESKWEYLTAVKWQGEPNSSAAPPLTVRVMNRDQTEEALFAADPHSGAMRELLVERDDAWINLEQSVPRWLPDGSGFLWLTERRGAWQLELRGPDGSLARELTPVGFGLQDLLAVDGARRAAYVKASTNPTESHVWRVPLDAGSRPVPLTTGAGLHSGAFSKDGALWVHTASMLDGAVTNTVRRAEGSVVREVKAVTETPSWRANVELVKVGSGEGWWCSIIRPRNFEGSRAYPVLNAVYGGPHTQVALANGRRALFNQWVADHGYIVVAIDARGTPGRGRAWERVIKNDLITAPLAEQVEAMKALGARYPEMDLSRVGMFGWSFGGYFSAHAALQRPDFFRAAVAGAPVTDWTDYDTFYTERYMGRPDRNVEGYRRSNALEFADGLRTPLMLIHGTADDNVYFMHSLKLADRLMRAGRPFEFLPLTGFTHMVVDPIVSARMYERMLGFFDEHVRGAAPATRPTQTGVIPAPAAGASDRQEAERAVATTLDALHRAASVADEDTYFALFAPEAVFLGTDPAERWTLDEFRAYALPHFQKDSAWTYRVISRRIFFDPSLQSGWFEETLENAKLGECRGSGALRPVVEDGAPRWKITQYNLTIPVPNEITPDVVGRIRAWRSGEGGGR